MCILIYIYIYNTICMCIYIYIYRERESSVRQVVPPGQTRSLRIRRLPSRETPWACSDWCVAPSSSQSADSESTNYESSTLFLGDSQWTWESRPSKKRIGLSQTLWKPDSRFAKWPCRPKSQHIHIYVSLSLCPSLSLSLSLYIYIYI